ncbi:ABC transporter permease [Paenibacillus albidus]|uniref:ABC transporter permease n=1 Tax=Paenibacillus albidus TaxID=2041023 RepID=A0A917D4E7_9BACL|nr:ABC-2 family transporter protein [Paenibacillus albidus]GGG07106.1 ABC transporter permease [Paenibacillus albidus]
MRRYLKMYRAYAKQYYLGQLQYKFATYSWLVGKILEPLIYLILWREIAVQNHGQVNGMTTNDVIAYYIILMVVNQFTFTDLIWKFSAYVNSGEFSSNLLLPAHPIHKDIAENIGYKLFSLPVILAAAIITSFYFHVAYDFTFSQILLFIPVLMAAFLFRFLFEWTISLSSFWFINMKGISSLYYILILFFSGRVVPLSMFPEQLQTLVEYLPFRYMVSYPIEILVSPGSTIPMGGVVNMAVWIIIIVFILNLFYKTSVKRFMGEGI